MRKNVTNINLTTLCIGIVYTSLIVMAYIYPLLTEGFLWTIASILGLFLCAICFTLYGRICINREIVLWLITLFPILFNSYSLRLREYSYTIIWILLLGMMILAQNNVSWCKRNIMLLFGLCSIYAISTVMINLGVTVGFNQLATIFRGTIAQGTFKTAGLTSHYSHNGMYIAVGCIIASSLYLESFNRKKNNLIAVLIFFSALLLTQKRGPLVAVAIAVVITYFLSKRETMSQKVKRMFGFSIIILATLYIAYEAFPELFSVIDRFSTDNMLTNRTYLWDYAIEMFKSSPVFGHGWGSYSHTLDLTTNTFSISNQNAHNIYFQILAETGIVGLTCFLVPMIYTLFKSMDLLKNMPQNHEGRIPMFASVSMQIFFLIYGLTGNSLYDRQMYIPYMLAITTYISYSVNYVRKNYIVGVIKID